MRQPSFQQWQHMRNMTPIKPLTVVVVEYTADGRAIERERMTVPAQRSGSQLPAKTFVPSRRRLH